MTAAPGHRIRPRHKTRPEVDCTGQVAHHQTGERGFAHLARPQEGDDGEGGQHATKVGFEAAAHHPRNDKGCLSICNDESSAFTEKLEGHLKSADFFDVERFPTATFRSTNIKAAVQGAATHTIKGDLTLHGITRRIAFPATLIVRGGEVSGMAEFSINRKDFGITYAGKADDLIREGVVLQINVRAAGK